MTPDPIIAQARDTAPTRARQFANILESFERMDRALAGADEILRDIKESHL